jgi:hypothetical protein
LPSEGTAREPLTGLDEVIDRPLEELPPIDEHGTLVLAPVEKTWQALLPVVRGSFNGSATERVARALGCHPDHASGDIGDRGSTVPGFCVVRVIEPAVLALQGEHRFSRYGLIFRLEPTKDERTLLRAETRAEFPGLKGKAYRTLVIGTRGHVVVVNRILRATRRRAERAGPVATG